MPYHIGKQQFDAMPSPRKHWVRFERTGHNDMPYQDSAFYLSEVARFLQAEVGPDAA